MNKKLSELETGVEKLIGSLSENLDAVKMEYIRITAGRLGSIGKMVYREFQAYMRTKYPAAMNGDISEIQGTARRTDLRNMALIKSFFKKIKTEYKGVNVSRLYNDALSKYKIMSKSKAMTKGYVNTVSRFVTAIGSEVETTARDGQTISVRTTYHIAVRRAVSELVNAGINRVDYKSGRSVRVDSAVRNAMMTEFGNVTRIVAETIGNDIGADGVEISAHAFCADDHEDVQGRVFTKEQYQKLQDTGYASDIDGEPVEISHSGNGSFRPIGMYNCHHVAYPFVIGVDETAYPKEYLEEQKTRNENGMTFGNKHMTLYEATQEQRRMETAMRYQRERITAFKEAADGNGAVMGDLKAARESLSKTRDTYKTLGKALNHYSIRTKMERSYVVKKNNPVGGRL
jgi:hypothetical protein